MLAGRLRPENRMLTTGHRRGEQEQQVTFHLILNQANAWASGLFPASAQNHTFAWFFLMSRDHEQALKMDQMNIFCVLWVFIHLHVESLSYSWSNVILFAVFFILICYAKVYGDWHLFSPRKRRVHVSSRWILVNRLQDLFRFLITKRTY